MSDSYYYLNFPLEELLSHNIINESEFEDINKPQQDFSLEIPGNTVYDKAIDGVVHCNNNEIFHITKTKNKKYKRNINKRKPKHNLEGVRIISRKHLSVETKKNRVQFQKDHKKIIYSYVDLTPPIDFNELFDLVTAHQNGGYTTKGKSFHFIRVDNEIQIVTFEQKQQIKREIKLKNKKKNKLNINQF